VEKVSVLVVIGVTVAGYRTVLGLQAGDKESATNWRELFKDLKRRGLDGGTIALGIMDGLPALERVFKEEFPKAKTQRCQVHVARNILAKVPKKLKEQIGDEVRSSFTYPQRRKPLNSLNSLRTSGRRRFRRQENVSKTHWNHVLPISNFRKMNDCACAQPMSSNGSTRSLNAGPSRWRPLPANVPVTCSLHLYV